MKIELPFAYKVSATTSRWRTPKGAVQLDFVAWNIPEVSAEDAPVAIEWEHVVGGPHARDRGHAYRREVRVVDGKFYTPFGTTGGRADFTRKFQAACLPRRDNHYYAAIGHFWDLWPYETDDPRMKALEEWFSDGVYCSELDNKNDVRIVSTEEETERKWAEATAARFILVDGEVFIRVGEPKLVFKAWQMPLPGAEVSMTFYSEDFALSLQEGPWGGPARRLHFRADDYHSLEDRVAAKGVHVDREEVRNVVVHMPQVFGFNATKELAYRTAMFALAATEGELGSIGRDAANAWYDVNEALTRFREDGNGNMLEEAISQAIPVLLEGMRASGHVATAELEECVEIWSSSEITLDLGNGPAKTGPKP
jgi:hypothetical protein